jgi:plastocyanin
VKRALTVAVVGLLIAGAAPGAGAASAEIQIRNNVFAPSDIRAEPGQRITWTLAEGRHTVTSDAAKRFDSGVMERAGESFSFTVPRADVTIFYHCRIHGIGGEGERWGSGMVGRIIVGKGSPVPTVASGIETRRVPSKRWPTLSAGLASLERDGRYRIELARGTYRPVDITPARLGFADGPDERFELTIRGGGRRPTDVVFSGAESLGMSVDGVRVENVSFRRQRFAAIFVRGIDRWSIDDVVIADGASHGVWIENAYRGRVRRASISGAKVAGISVRGCDECDLLIDSVMVQRSLQGLSAIGAGALIVRGSVFRDNGVGIAMKAALGDAALHRGADISLNTFRNNDRRISGAPEPGLDRDLPVGAGVWIDGGAFDVVHQNDFDGHSFGVVLTGASRSSRVVGNTVRGSAEADLAWDGMGWNVCFADNTAPDGAAGTSMPPAAQDVYACALPTTVGVPYPLVTATLLGWGTGALNR